MEIVIQNKDLAVTVKPINDLSFYQKFLSNHEIVQQVNQFGSYQRKCEWLNTLFLIEQLTGVVQLYEFINQKPRCKDTHHYLGISHSDNYSALAISADFFVSVDIEENTRNFTKVSKKFLHLNETNWCTTNDLLRLIWCSKETVYKLLPQASPNFSKDYEILYTPNILQCNNLLVRYLEDVLIQVNIFKTSKYLLTWAIHN